jgi:hypothetical protein
MKMLTLRKTGKKNKEGMDLVEIIEDSDPPDIGTPPDFDPSLLFAIGINKTGTLLSWGKTGKHPGISEELLDEFLADISEGEEPGVYITAFGVLRLTLDEFPGAPEDLLRYRLVPVGPLEPVLVVRFPDDSQDGENSGCKQDCECTKCSDACSYQHLN